MKPNQTESCQPSLASSARCATDDELIDVLRIRLRNRANATVLLSEFRAAERILTCWADQSLCDQVEFEVTFCDGCVVRGSFPAVHVGRRKRSLGALVIRLLDGIVPASTDVPEGPLSRYLIPF